METETSKNNWVGALSTAKATGRRPMMEVTSAIFFFLVGCHLLFVKDFTKHFHINDLMSDSTGMCPSSYTESVLSPDLAGALAL